VRDDCDFLNASTRSGLDVYRTLIRFRFKDQFNPKFRLISVDREVDGREINGS